MPDHTCTFCEYCKLPLQPVHGHAACHTSGCPMFGLNVDPCCGGEVQDTVPATCLVGDIQIFTKLLDGGYPAQCVCGYMWRTTGYGDRGCPACGRDSEVHSTRIPMEIYKDSRKD